MKKMSYKFKGALTIIIFWWVLLVLHLNLKRLALLFHILIHVHPCHPLQQTTGTGSKPKYSLK